LESDENPPTAPTTLLCLMLPYGALCAGHDCQQCLQHNTPAFTLSLKSLNVLLVLLLVLLLLLLLAACLRVCCCVCRYVRLDGSVSRVQRMISISQFNKPGSKVLLCVLLYCIVPVL
jgi:hypothetical protein